MSWNSKRASRQHKNMTSIRYKRTKKPELFRLEIGRMRYENYLFFTCLYNAEKKEIAGLVHFFS